MHDHYLKPKVQHTSDMPHQFTHINRYHNTHRTHHTDRGSNLDTVAECLSFSQKDSGVSRQVIAAGAQADIEYRCRCFNMHHTLLVCVDLKTYKTIMASTKTKQLKY